MADDFAISPTMPVTPALTERSTPTAPFTETGTTAAAASVGPKMNPGFRLDPALNLAVLQFFDEKGDVTQTIPSQKQLAAYQQNFGLKSAKPSSA